MDNTRGRGEGGVRREEAIEASIWEMIKTLKNTV
jgi:hypothetical protein